MTSIGDSLKRAREDKGLEIERVAEETRIAKRFILALETEDFSVFPGEPYALGFLRNYADYLGLDSDDLASSFRMLRIQEQPVPIQQLIPAKRANPLVFVVAGAAFALVVVAAIVFLGRGRNAGEVAATENHAPTEYRLEGPELDKRLWVGDSVLVNAGNETWKISLAQLGDGSTFDTPVGQRRLSLGEETLIDLDKDGQADLRILLTDLDKKNAARGANLRFSLLGPALAATGSSATDPARTSSPNGDLQAGSPPSPQASPALAPASLPPPSATESTATTTREGVIFEALKTPYPFVVSVTFRASCMFRYEVDKRDRDERYYQKGDTISINANNAVKLWASNAQSAAVVIQASGGKTAEVDLGASGEVAVKRIAWVQNDNGSYTLSFFEVD